MIAAQMDDWIEILRHFPQDAVQRACIQYLGEEERKRPTPASIRNRAAEFVRVSIEREKHLALAAPQRAALPAPTDEDNARVLEYRRKMAEEIMAGYARARRVEPAPVAVEPAGPRPGYLDPESPANALLRRAMRRDEPTTEGDAA